MIPSNRHICLLDIFLIGEPLTQLPAADYTNVKCNRLSRWQTYQQQLQQFWQRWSSDYLQSLQQRKRWQKTSPNLQIGDLVLLREDNMTPLQWPKVSSRRERRMASYEWLLFVPQREHLNDSQQKFSHYRVEIVNCRLIFFWVAVCPRKGKLCVTFAISNWI